MKQKIRKDMQSFEIFAGLCREVNWDVTAALRMHNQIISRQKTK
jgi:hypothetical protein